MILQLPAESKYVELKSRKTVMLRLLHARGCAGICLQTLLSIIIATGLVVQTVDAQYRSGSIVKIVAKGERGVNGGLPDMRLTIKGKELKVWNDISEDYYLQHWHATPRELVDIDDIHVSTSTRPEDGILYVDKIIVDDIHYQAEAPTVYFWSPDGHEGYWETERLHYRGNLGFNHSLDSVKFDFAPGRIDVYPNDESRDSYDRFNQWEDILYWEITVDGETITYSRPDEGWADAVRIETLDRTRQWTCVNARARNNNGEWTRSSGEVCGYAQPGLDATKTTYPGFTRFGVAQSLPCNLMWSYRRASNGHEQPTVCTQEAGSNFLTDLKPAIDELKIRAGRERGGIWDDNGLWSSYMNADNMWWLRNAVKGFRKAKNFRESSASNIRTPLILGLRTGIHHVRKCNADVCWRSEMETTGDGRLVDQYDGNGNLANKAVDAMPFLTSMLAGYLDDSFVEIGEYIRNQQDIPFILRPLYEINQGAASAEVRDFINYCGNADADDEHANVNRIYRGRAMKTYTYAEQACRLAIQNWQAYANSHWNIAKGIKLSDWTNRKVDLPAAEISTRKLAFWYLVDHVREGANPDGGPKTKNLAWMWHYNPCVPNNTSLPEWKCKPWPFYVGNPYVDYIGFSWFGSAQIDDTYAADYDSMHIADWVDKPVIIVESGPVATGTENAPASLDFFNNVFDRISANERIVGWAHINWNWSTIGWASEYGWKDTRLQTIEGALDLVGERLTTERAIYSSHPRFFGGQ